MLAQHVVTLTMNPALDLSAAVGKVEPIHKLRCTEPRRDPGGGGINVARVLRRLGGDVSAVFPVGGLAGAELEALMQAEGVHAVPVAIAGDTREDVTIMETTSGRQYRFVMPGPTLSAAEQTRCLDALVLPHGGADLVVASGSLPPGVAPIVLCRDRAPREGAKPQADRRYVWRGPARGAGRGRVAGQAEFARIDRTVGKAFAG